MLQSVRVQQSTPVLQSTGVKALRCITVDIIVSVNRCTTVQSKLQSARVQQLTPGLQSAGVQQRNTGQQENNTCDAKIHESLTNMWCMMLLIILYIIYVNRSLLRSTCVEESESLAWEILLMYKNIEKSAMRVGKRWKFRLSVLIIVSTG